MSSELHAALTKAYEDQVETPIAEDASTNNTVNDAKEEAYSEEVATPLNVADEEASEPEIEAPEQWSNEDKDVFKAIDKKGKEFILRRHREMEAAHTRKSQKFAEEIRVAEKFNKIIEKHKPHLDQLKIDPFEAFDKLVSTDVRFRTGSDQEKTALMNDLARYYAARLDPEAAPMAPIDPRLLDVVKRQEERLAQIENERIEQERSSLQNLVVSFSTEKDDKGHPKHPHFESVRQQMGQLMTAGVARTLDEAYEQAILINADLRKEYFSKQFREEDTAKKTVASRKASLNVKGGSDATISDPTREMTLAQTIRAAYDAQTKGSRI